jgi:hypothetical protein
LESPHLGSLRGLVLRFNGLDDEAVAELATMGSLLQLRTLDLYGNSLRYESGIHMAGVSAITHSPDLRQLTTLVLGDNWVRDDGVARLGRAWAWANLRELYLTFNQITDTGLRDLARCPHLAKLETLDVGYNPVGLAGIRAVLAATERTVVHCRGTKLRRASCESLQKEFGTRIVF